MTKREIIQPDVLYLPNLAQHDYTPREQFVTYQLSQGIDVRTPEEKDAYEAAFRAWFDGDDTEGGA